MKDIENHLIDAMISYQKTEDSNLKGIWDLGLSCRDQKWIETMVKRIGENITQISEEDALTQSSLKGPRPKNPNNLIPIHFANKRPCKSAYVVKQREGLWAVYFEDEKGVWVRGKLVIEHKTRFWNYNSRRDIYEDFEDTVHSVTIIAE
jgi:hypothetical protein